MNLPDKIKEAAEKYAKDQGTHDKPEITAHDFKAGCSFLLPEIERRAIAFAEFIRINEIHVHPIDKNWFKVSDNRMEKEFVGTSTDLYKIFLAEYEKNKLNICK